MQNGRSRLQFPCPNRSIATTTGGPIEKGKVRLRPLLNPQSEFYVPRHLSRCGLTCAIVFAEGMPADLPAELSNDMACLDMQAIAEGIHDCLIVYAPGNEAAALADLRQRFPGQRFAGLGEEVFPALLARQAPLAILEAEGEGPPCQALTLVLSTPRSGSSRVADVLGELGQGDCREHLRGDLAAALATTYRFDLSAALRRFLFLLGRTGNGRASTKLIVGHLVNWLATRPDPRPLRDAMAGVTLHCIITDRADRVAQAVSGTIAEISGVWQNRSQADSTRIRRLTEADYTFATLFWRFLSYRHQGHLLNEVAGWFPRALRLAYDTDIADATSVELARRISLAFGWPFDPATYVDRAQHCKPTASPLARVFQHRFATELQDLGITTGGMGPSAPAVIAGPAVTEAPRLVLVGFNKCGTSSISDLFRQCGHPAAHWRTDDGQFLAPLIFSNLHLGRPLLQGLSRYAVISDLFYLDEKVYLEANSLFDRMAKDHPQTRFLLNTRDREAWISSRLSHETPGSGRIIDRACAYFGLPPDRVAELWRDQWDRHHDAVRRFFAADPWRCLEYDIERDSPETLSRWLGPGWKVDPTRMRHLNRTARPSAVVPR